MENKQETKYYVYIKHTETSQEYEIKPCESLHEAYQLYQQDPLQRKVLKEIQVGVIVVHED